MLYPYVGLRAEDTVETRVVKNGAHLPPFRYSGVVVPVGEEYRRAGELAEAGAMVVLLLDDGTHVPLGFERVKLHPDDLPEAHRRLATQSGAFTTATRPTADQLDELREPRDG